MPINFSKLAHSLLVLLFTIVLVVGGVFVFSQMNQNPESQPTPTPNPSPSSAPTSTSQSTPEIPEDWLTYRNEELGFEVKYPQNMEIRQVGEEAIQFTLDGPTQTQETDFFDGIQLSLFRESYDSDRVLRDHVQERLMEKVEDPARNEYAEVEVKKQVSQIVVGQNLSGYTFTIGAVNLDAKTDFIYLPYEEGKAFVIMSLILDPRSQNFGNVANLLLSSFSITKR